MAMHITPDNRLKKLIVIGDRLLIKPTKPNEQTASGLYLPPGVQERLGLPKGVIVVGVAEDGPGARSGLAIGDVITTWDGTAVAGVRDLLNRLAESSVGQSAKVGVLRGGNAIDLQVVIGERPRT